MGRARERAVAGPGRLSHLALPCLAYLASHRPRSPCLHLATTARPPSAAGRRGAPLLLLLVQARRARPMRGEVSQASQGQVSTPIHTTTNYDELRRTTTNYDELRRTPTNYPLLFPPYFSLFSPYFAHQPPYSPLFRPTTPLFPSYFQHMFEFMSEKRPPSLDT